MSNNVDEREKKAYVSLYKKDGLSFGLSLSAIAAELVYVISVLDVITVSFWMGITVMINIAVLFLLFTCAVKMNVYEKKLAYAALVLGVYMLLRQLVLVPVILQPYSRQLLIAAANFAGGALLIAAGYVSTVRCSRRKKLQEKIGDTDEPQKVG